MRNVLSAALTWIGILGVVASAAAQPDAARPTIHRVTVDSQSGVLTITGAGLGPHLIVSVEGTSVPLLPGATDTHVEVAPPPALLTTPGTYRLTAVDPVRQMGDAFVVASQAAPVGLGSGALTATWTVAPGAAPSPNEPTAVSRAAATVRSYASGPSPLTVIEDSGPPYRTAIGFEALVSNTSGSSNTASGHQALRSNTTGGGNTASGLAALYSNTTGSYNTASGYNALYKNTTGADNTANGAEALFSNTTGFSNTASGRNALVSNSTGFYNTASGSGALYANTTGATNTASGVSALYSNTTGDANTATGASALASNTSGASNTALGYGAGNQATTGSFNLFLGAQVTGTAADANTIRIGLPYDGGTGVGQNRTFIAGIRGTQLTGSAVQVFIDANGQLGTLTPPIVTGTLTLPVSQLQQQVSAQQKQLTDQQTTVVQLQQQLRDQHATIAYLRAQLAELKTLVARTAARK